MSHRKAKAQRGRPQIQPFRKVEESEILRAWGSAKVRPLLVFRSAQFLAAVYPDPNGYLRLSINRVTLSRDNSGRWEDGITWDEIQAIKSAIGLGDTWGVECFPPDAEVVDVANMRHIFLLKSAPPFAWLNRIGSTAPSEVKA